MSYDRQTLLLAAHERLKAPVNAIAGFAEIVLLSVQRSGSVAEIGDATLIHEAALRLIATMDGLLGEESSAEPDDASLQRRFRHDLRSPMNLIQGYGEILLEESALPPDVRQDIETLLFHANEMLESLDHIFEFKREGGVREEDHAAAVALELEDMGPVDIAPGQILVVDDLAANRALLRRRLELAGHTVTEAGGGYEALQLAATRDFELILLDVMMPDLDGIQVLQRLRADPKTKQTPILMVSAFDTEQSVIQCLQHGANDYLIKPLNQSLLSTRVNNAIDRNRLLLVRRSLLQRLESEVNEAHELQRDLMPRPDSLRALPESVDIAGVMKPAREVSGDFFDVFQVGDRHVFTLIADVSDKGVAAGMYMTRARNALRMTALGAFLANQVIITPRDLVKMANSELSKPNEQGNFVTLFLTRIDLSTGVVEYVTCGHEPALLVSAEHVVSPLPHVSHNVPLGLIEDFDFVSDELQLPPGAAIVAYSDGVTDATSPNGVRFGLERLRASCAATTAQGSIDRIVASTTAFVCGREPFDDLTALVVRRPV